MPIETWIRLWFGVGVVLTVFGAIWLVVAWARRPRRAGAWRTFVAPILLLLFGILMVINHWDQARIFGFSPW